MTHSPPTPRAGGRRACRYAPLGDSFSAGAAGAPETGFADRLARILGGSNAALEVLRAAAPGALSREVADERRLPCSSTCEDRGAADARRVGSAAGKSVDYRPPGS